MSKRDTLLLIEDMLQSSLKIKNTRVVKLRQLVLR